MKIAFDVDDTLIIPSIATDFGRDTPNYETINLYKWFQSQGHYMIIWSGGGQDYAKQWAERHKFLFCSWSLDQRVKPLGWIVAPNIRPV